MAKRFPILAILVLCSLALFLTGCGGAQAYTASGRITLTGDPGSGVPGVTLFLLPSTQKAQTDGDGNWSASLKGTVRVVPAGLGWTFTPPSKEVKSSDLVADFSATANSAAVTAIAAGWLAYPGLATAARSIPGATPPMDNRASAAWPTGLTFPFRRPI